MRWKLFSSLYLAIAVAVVPPKANVNQQTVGVPPNPVTAVQSAPAPVTKPKPVTKVSMKRGRSKKEASRRKKHETTRVRVPRKYHRVALGRAALDAGDSTSSQPLFFVLLFFVAGIGLSIMQHTMQKSGRV